MYQSFAEYYDILMADVDYKGRAEYLLGLFKKYDRSPCLLLDLACGTGGFSNEISQTGISVIGVDISEEMLYKASENSRNLGLDVLYLCQDMTELDLFGTVDGAICCMDSLNHITDYKDFSAALKKLSLFLEKDRLFIFDVNSVYKHHEILGNETFVIEDENIYLVWQNEFDEERNITDITLDFFRSDGSVYTRETEYISERAYTPEEISAALSAAGLEIVDILGDMSSEKPQADDERIIYITKKL